MKTVPCLALMAISHTGPAHNKRHAITDIIGRLVIPPNIELALIFAVVGTDDNRGVLVNTHLFQVLHNLANMMVRKVDARIIAVHMRLGIVERLDMPTAHAPTVRQLVGNTRDFRRAMRTKTLVLPVDKILGNPIFDWFVGKGITVFFRMVIGRVRIP